MTLCLRNRQKDCRLDLRVFRRIMRHVLRQQLQADDAEVCFHFVTAPEMAIGNLKYLNHSGPTDVITFDYAMGARPLHGEVFICPAVAVAQAREFQTTWQSEVVRYSIHGLLHLRGLDDQEPAARRLMKREENRLLKDVSSRFDVARLKASKAK